MSKPHSGGADHLGEAQTLVDELSDALGRSVDVDNAHLELVCASAQVGPIDAIRVQAIIDRAPPPKPLPWVLGHGIATAAGPVRLPRNDEFGMLPRVCLPLRHDGGLVGYLWLFDEPPVTDSELAAATRTAVLLAPLLGADDAALRQRADERQRLVLRVASGSVAAVEEAVSCGYLAERGSFTVASAVLADTAADLLPGLARRQLGRPFLAGVVDGRLLAVGRGANDAPAALARVAGSLLVAVGTARASDVAGLSAAAGRAGFAADVAALEGARARGWEDLGSWRALYGRPLVRETVGEVSADAERLVQDGTPEQWRTVLAYLDAGRRVSAACRVLAVHRATLYYRLDRVRELLGAEALDDGWRAVALHLALRLHSRLPTPGSSAHAVP